MEPMPLIHLITGQTNDDGIIKIQIMVPLSNFWRILETPLINCEINLILTWSVDCVIIYANIANHIPAIPANLYVPVVLLSTQDNEKLFPQLKPGFKRTISWNKYLSKPELLA